MIIITTAIIIIIKMTILKHIKKATLLFVSVFNCFNSSVLVSIYMCICQHVEIIQIKTLTGLTDCALSFFNY